MKHLKQFEGFRDWFKSKEDKQKEEMFSTKDLSKTESTNKSEIMIDSDPYDVSQFGQKKYGVYIETPNSDRYYIGDIREFKSGGILSYLNLDKITKKEPTQVLVHPNEEQMDIINGELNKNYLSPNLMDDTITYREKLKNDLNIEL